VRDETVTTRRTDEPDALIERAANAIAAVLCECCTVEEIEDVLATINPEDWKLAARRVLELAVTFSAEELHCLICAMAGNFPRQFNPIRMDLLRKLTKAQRAARVA
jgi:hypothetical protein